MFCHYIENMSNLNDQDKADKESKEEETKKEESIENKLKSTEDKLLRSLAELENQRNRFQKEIKEAIVVNLNSKKVHQTLLLIILKLKVFTEYEFKTTLP